MTKALLLLLVLLFQCSSIVLSQEQDEQPTPPPPVSQQGLIGVNWGTQLSHPLFAPDVIKMLRANNIARVKLFEADRRILKALAGSHLEVMVGIPNDMLDNLANNMDAAHDWVKSNITTFYRQSKRVNIKYVAVGNEPFLAAYNRSFNAVTLPALKNIQAALAKAKLSEIKATVPLNADVLESATGTPSGGVFRNDIKLLMVDIVKSLNSTGSPFTINLYPYISLYQDPNFPVEFAFFDGNLTLADGSNLYTNVFDASFDMLVAALRDAGYPEMEIIVGEAGWPTDAAIHADASSAQRFNQGLLNRILKSTGTPQRPGAVLHAYLFSLFDEDLKSIAPGTFERHWGVFTYDGQPKYPLDTSGSGEPTTLAKVHGVEYQPARWCVLRPGRDSPPADQITFACSYSDCTALAPDFGSCSSLSPAEAASYAFNSYFQLNDQSSCDFEGAGIVTGIDPSTPSCRFDRQVQLKPSAAERLEMKKFSAFMFVLVIILNIV